MFLAPVTQLAGSWPNFSASLLTPGHTAQVKLQAGQEFDLIVLR